MKITIDGTIYTNRFSGGFVVFDYYSDETEFLGYFANLYALATFIESWIEDDSDG